MPPKKPVKKIDEKKAQKIVEDKTFGLKNKKGAKMQKYIAQIQNQVKGNMKGGPQNQQGKKKKDEEDDLKDLSKIFKPVQTMPKLGQDVDPKSVLCVFFKQGMCQKGNKCKFSHDLAVQQKTAKRNLYFDNRDAKKEDEHETNENWDEKQLTEVAEKKHGEKDRKRPNQTDIVCKYFIEAVENSKYGWFWECPNGETCIYRHALPPGYVLKKDRKRMDELKKLDEISLEELIEKERAALSSQSCKKVTLESFIAWKKRKLREKQKRAADAEKQKRTNFKSGRQVGLSGRELFTFNPDLIGEDDEAADDDKYEREVEEEEGEPMKAFEIDDSTFMTLDDGKRLDVFDEEEEIYVAAASAGGQSTLVFDENLFDGDAVVDLPSDDDEDEEEEVNGEAGEANDQDEDGDDDGLSAGPLPGFDAKPGSSGTGANRPNSSRTITSGESLKQKLNV